MYLFVALFTVYILLKVEILSTSTPYSLRIMLNLLTCDIDKAFSFT